MTDEATVRDALARVQDTCSIFNRTNLSILDMGIVQAVRIDSSRVTVRLLLTDPSCSFLFEIGQRIREEVGTIPDVDSVEIESSTDERWTPDRMTVSARERLQRLRAERLAACGLSPRGR